VWHLQASMASRGAWIWAGELVFGVRGQLQAMRREMDPLRHGAAGAAAPGDSIASATGGRQMHASGWIRR